MAEGRIGVGIIGCGWIAEIVHLPGLRAHPRFRLEAFADPSEARRAVAARLAPRARAYPTAEALLADPAVEAVVVAVPPAVNRPVVEAALAAGRDVYVEKPLALSAADARAMAAAAARSGRRSMVGYNFRFSPVVQAARRSIAAAAIGPVVGVQARLTWAAGAVDGWRAEPDGGGALFDLASHHLDLFAVLTGQVPVRVAAHARSLVRPGDTVDLTADGDAGAVLQLHVGGAAGADENRLTVVGREGRLDLDLADPWRGPRLRRRGGGPRLGEALRPLHPRRLLPGPRPEPSFARAFDAFAEACAGDGPPSPGLHDGVAVLEALEAAQASMAAGGAPVAVVRP
jgi:predicted dehydrogenase